MAIKRYKPTSAARRFMTVHAYDEITEVRPERGLVEELRTDSLMIGPFKQAQVLSFFVFMGCLGAYMYFQRKGKRRQQ